MAIEDMDEFAEKIRRGVEDCVIIEILAERLAASEHEIEIALPIEVAFQDSD
jgi:hypothetical protein